MLIATLMTLGAVYVARPILVPICFAWLLKVALAPAVRRLNQTGVPIAGAAAIVMALVALAFTIGVYELTDPATKWLRDLPEQLPQLEYKLADLRGSLDTVSEVTEKVEKIADASASTSGPVQVEMANRPTLLSTLFTGASAFLASTVLTFALLFFMLATDTALLAKLVEATPRFRDKKAIVSVVRTIESSVGRYLMTLILVNTLLGAAVGGAMWALDMPNPALWGALAGLLNFVPYVGAVIGISVVATVALIEFGTIGEILAPPLFYLVINSIEGLLITPIVIGRRLAVSPVALFIWLMFASWMWGLPGALLAVPLLVVLKITGDQVPALAPMNILISR